MASRWTQDTLDELAVSHKVHTLKPIEWPQESLGNLFTLQLGKMLNRKARETFPKFPYLGNKDVQWGRFNFSELREMHFDEEERTKFRLIPGDLLVCEGGEIGRTALWTDEFDCYYQKAIHRLRVRTPVRIEARFVLHFMRFAATNRLFTDLSSQSSIAHLTREKLALLKVPLPPLPEQRKIAAILSSLDDAIDKTQAVIEQVQVVKRGLMQELLTRGVPGRHSRFKQTEIGEIPEEWDLLPLAALAQDGRGLQTGPFGSQLHASDYVKAGVPVLMPKDMMNGYASDADSARISEEKAEELSRHKVQEGDILFARRGELGRVGLVTKLQEGWLCGTGCLRFRPSDRAVSRYLRQWVAWPTSARWLNEHAVGQTMLNLNTSILGRLPVALPDDTERSAIVDVLEAFERRVRTLKENIEGLGQAKRSLMSVLLTGELRVTPDTEAA